MTSRRFLDYYTTANCADLIETREVCAFNRTVSKVDEFLANEARNTKVIGAHSIEEMCRKLKKPRRVMMLVKAGLPVDSMIESIVPHLESGDIIIDGGNSEYTDTNVSFQFCS
uniref:NAD_binding_2 domain-containing protein n=1 Tax=Angiostrongylus cantonensis TaxID=6313 RepID=A0A0K0DNE8_ANGCA